MRWLQTGAENLLRLRAVAENDDNRVAKRRTKREYLLRGLIYCGCGRHMSGTKGRYLCTRRYHYYELDQCQEPLVLGWLIDPITWDYIMGLIKSPEQFEKKLREAQAKELNNTQPKRKELDHVIALLKSTEQEANDIARAITRTKGLVAEKLEQQAHEVDQRYRALTVRKFELQEALKFDLTDRNIDSLMRFRETVAAGLDNPTFEDKRRWLEILQVAVIVTKQKAVITCRLSSEPFAFDLKTPDPQTGGGSNGGHTGFRTSASSKAALRKKWWRQGRKRSVMLKQTRGLFLTGFCAK